ncbi:ATP-grasp domain-containing protein (plasmid) [Pseudomonas sp. FeN3W]|nr:ATP-grasp domain-containing protein [Pseudomonas sp. FeN3W]
MTTPVIWFNDGLSVMAEAIQALRSENNTISKIIVSHKNPYFVGFDMADTFVVENVFDSSKAYADWALSFAKEHGVTHFFVGRHGLEISRRKQLFEEAGVALLYTLTPDQWNDIDDKAAFYNRLNDAGHCFMLPHWRIWRDSYRGSGLRPLIEEIVSVPSTPARQACVKPVRGIFGQGFFLFNEEPDASQQLFFPEEKVISPSTFGSLAYTASAKEGKERDWMIMEYLPGPEYSVDTLAYEGELVTFVARQKSDVPAEGQQIVGDADIVEQLRILAQEFKLSGVFNAQFRRDVNGDLRVLEINPRFSGGMGMSLKAGVNLPFWWLQLVMTEGRCIKDIPQANIGMRVYSWHTAVQITDHSQATQGCHKDMQ